MNPFLRRLFNCEKPSFAEDDYIRLLKQAKDDLINGKQIFYNDFKTRLEGSNLSEHAESIFVKIYRKEGSNPGSGKHIMNLDSYMMLQEYSELQLALSESKQARKEARVAIWISILIGTVPVVLWAVDKITSK